MSSLLKKWLAEMSQNQCDWFTEKERVLSSDLRKDTVSLDPFAGGDAIYRGVSSYRGGRDDEGRWHGGGVVAYANGDQLLCDFEHGVRHGDCVVISPGREISRLCGHCVDGELQGRITLVGKETSVLDGWVKSGCLHGLARKIDLKKFREFRRQLSFVGMYHSGIPNGPCWQYKEGGGFLYGVVDDRSGEFSGDDIAFIYPDMETCWLGKFKKGEMIKAKKARIVSAKINANGIAIPRIMIGKSETNGGVGLCRSTKTDMGKDLLVTDPYEEKHIYCAESRVPGSGEGIFANIDMAANTVVAFYNGVRLPYVLGGPKEDWSTSGYKIFVNADFVSGERMNIPTSMTGLDSYSASLGHKVNHSFAPNCDEWFFDHPRFGIVPCIRLKEAVAADTELFLDYEYDPYNCPEWFREELVCFVQRHSEERLEVLNKRYHKFVMNECDIKL